MMRIVWCLISAVVAACQYNPRPIDNDDAAGAPDGPAGTPDARDDAPPGDPCNDWTFTPAEFDVCGIPGPDDTSWDPGLIDIGSGAWTLDGDNGELTNGADTINVPVMYIDGVAVISVDHLVIANNASLRGTGNRPIAIVSWNAIDISGTLDVTSRTNAPAGRGAGANSPNCPIGAMAPQEGTPSGNGDGGGGGAGFGDAGGAGGNGDTGAGPGGAAGFARALASPPRIEGGCRGANATGANGTPGIGGAGGGAIFLVARLELAVTGIIHAGGAGGGGGINGGQVGGGGGGSGGMIKLEAGTITIDATAVLSANGGQGGGGNDNNDADPGADSEPSLDPASVNNNEGMGTDGGDGGVAGATVGQAALQSTRGGGGGGGGVGYIVYAGHPTTSIDAATITPEATQF